MASEMRNNARNWRFRAEETRTLADDMNDLEARVIMLRIAADYDSLADRVESRVNVVPLRVDRC